MLNKLRFWLYSSPWYGLRMHPDTQILPFVAWGELETQKDAQSDLVRVYVYYPRLRDFVRHVQCFGFPKLYCPKIARLKAFFTP